MITFIFPLIFSYKIVSSDCQKMVSGNYTVSRSVEKCPSEKEQRKILEADMKFYKCKKMSFEALYCGIGEIK